MDILHDVTGDLTSEYITPSGARWRSALLGIARACACATGTPPGRRDGLRAPALHDHPIELARSPPTFAPPSMPAARLVEDGGRPTLCRRAGAVGARGADVEIRSVTRWRSLSTDASRACFFLGGTRRAAPHAETCTSPTGHQAAGRGHPARPDIEMTKADPPARALAHRTDSLTRCSTAARSSAASLGGRPRASIRVDRHVLMIDLDHFKAS